MNHLWKYHALKTIVTDMKKKGSIYQFNVKAQDAFAFYLNLIQYVKSTGIHSFPLIIDWPRGQLSLL